MNTRRDIHHEGHEGTKGILCGQAGRQEGFAQRRRGAEIA